LEKKLGKGSVRKERAKESDPIRTGKDKNNRGRIQRKREIFYVADQC
jgi:hypothetical protein